MSIRSPHSLALRLALAAAPVLVVAVLSSATPADACTFCSPLPSSPPPGPSVCALTAPSVPTPVPGTEGNAASALICMINSERRSSGRPALTSDPFLTSVAQGHINWMLANHNCGHLRDTFGNPVPPPGSNGEILSWGAPLWSPYQAMYDGTYGWISEPLGASPPNHHDIILGAYARIGAAASASVCTNGAAGATYAVEFGR